MDARRAGMGDGGIGANAGDEAAGANKNSAARFAGQRCFSGNAERYCGACEKESFCHGVETAPRFPVCIASACAACGIGWANRLRSDEGVLTQRHAVLPAVLRR